MDESNNQCTSNDGCISKPQLSKIILNIVTTKRFLFLLLKILDLPHSVTINSMLSKCTTLC